MKPWRITWRDKSWTDNDVTTAHVVLVTRWVGDGWTSLDPWSSPVALTGWLVALTGEPREVMTAQGAELLAALTVREE